MAQQTNKPLDAAQAASAAFTKVQDQPFPQDIFTAPQLSWAVIGCGIIANQMAQSLALAGRKLAGVYNRTLPKAQAFAERYGVDRVYESLEQLCADPSIDAVYITTPHNTHIRFLRAALSAGKHVLCEKAITLNSTELAEARQIARQHNVVLLDATTILHMPLYHELRRRANAGEFGPLNLAQVNFGSYKEYGDLKNRFYNPNLAGGAMLDIGVYAITFARLFLASQPNEVVSLANRSQTGVDQTSGIVMRNPDGQIATFTLSLHSKQPKRGILSFDKCYIQVDGYPRADQAQIVWTADGHVEQVSCGAEGYALDYEVAHLERAVAGDAQMAGLLDYASDVMDLMTQLRYQWGVFYPEEKNIQESLQHSDGEDTSAKPGAATAAEPRA